MINISDKVNCCGCNACGDVCTRGAITFQTDIEGFWYPIVDKDRCTNCGLCEKVCPELYPEESRRGNDEKPFTYVVQLANNKERFNSTSGCLYPMMAKKILEEGGWIAGHIFDKDYSVKTLITNRIEDLEVLRNSKYLQSDARSFYKGIKKILQKGETVLASGCPCQMAALKLFLGKGYDNLITVDFTCMGIDTPLAFRKYLDSLEDIYGSKITEFKSKCKEVGWRRLANKVIFENGKTYLGVNGVDANLNATFLDILVRPSCYYCKFKGQQRIADISIGDYWTKEWDDYRKLDFSIDDNSGTSYAMLNNDRAKKFFLSISSWFVKREIDVLEIIKGNPFAVKSLPKPNIDRTKFYKDLHTQRFDVLVSKQTKKATSLWRSKLRIIKHIIVHYHLNPFASFRCIMLNLFSKHIKGNFWNGDVLYISPNLKLNFSKNSTVNIKGYCKIMSSDMPIVIELNENSNLSLNRTMFLGDNIRIKLWKGASVSIGFLTALSDNVRIEAMKRISIGEFCHLGHNVLIADNNNMVLTTNDSNPIHAEIKIGTHCLLKDGSIVTKGTSLADEVIVNENSVVHGETSPRTVLQGNPAVVVDSDVLWKNNV